MKRIWKGALACSMMALAVPMLVACDKTPAWQKVDNINTKANYSTDVGYDDIYGVLTAEGDDALSTMTNKKVKISYEMSGDDSYMILSGVVDPSSEGEDDDVKAALKMKMAMTMMEQKMTSSMIVYVTKDFTYYLDMSIVADDVNEHIKIKVSPSELTEFFADPSLGMESPDEFFEMLGELNTVPAIAEIFETEQANFDKFTYGIAENETTGVTKYKMTLKKDQTVTEMVDMIMGEVEGTVKSGVIYMAVKDNVIIEAYQNAVVEIEDVQMTAKLSINEYKSAMPAHGSGYQSYTEWIASQQSGQD